jgi:radical SAM superfamily enzyme YgiQ (UPF0313 family)
MRSSRKIVLYSPQSASNPHPPNSRWADELPLSLLTIAAWPLADGFEVVLIDGSRFTRADAHRRVVEACEGALLYATTGILGPQLLDGLQCTRAVKARHSGLPAFVGGWFASVAPELHLRTGLYDAAAIGQGEITFRELVAAVASGEPLDSVAGLALLRDGEVVRTPPRAVVGWDRLLDCPWHLLDVDDYKPRAYVPKVKGPDANRFGMFAPGFQVSYYSSFGCPVQCTFCCSPQVSGLRWKPMPAERMLDDLCALQDRWGFDGVHFYDANFAVDVRRADAFARGLLDRGRRVSWFAYLQAESILRAGDATLDAMSDSGFYGCILGAEAGSEDQMHRVRKNTRAGGNRLAAIELDRRGVQPRMTYIIGYPDEDRASMLATIDEARRIYLECPNARPEVWHYRPIPGTVDHARAVELGFSSPPDLEGWGRIGDYWNEEPWPGRVPADVELKRRLFMHYSSLAQGAVRHRIGWWERRAKQHLVHDAFGAKRLEARAFHLYDGLTRRIARRRALQRAGTRLRHGVPEIAAN